MKDKQQPDIYEVDPSYTAFFAQTVEPPPELEAAICQRCHTGDDEDKLLLCDSCNDAWHTYCLIPALTAVPEGNWFCGTCTRSQEQMLTEAEEKKQNGDEVKSEEPAIRAELDLTTDSPTTANSSAAGNPGRRGRGRPRKNTTTNQAQKPTTSRPRIQRPRRQRKSDTLSIKDLLLQSKAELERRIQADSSDSDDSSDGSSDSDLDASDRSFVVPDSEIEYATDYEEAEKKEKEADAKWKKKKKQKVKQQKKAHNTPISTPTKQNKRQRFKGNHSPAIPSATLSVTQSKKVGVTKKRSSTEEVVVLADTQPVPPLEHDGSIALSQQDDDLPLQTRWEWKQKRRRVHETKIAAVQQKTVPAMMNEKLSSQIEDISPAESQLSQRVSELADSFISPKPRRIRRYRDAQVQEDSPNAVVRSPSVVVPFEQMVRSFSLHKQRERQGQKEHQERQRRREERQQTRNEQLLKELQPKDQQQMQSSTASISTSSIVNDRLTIVNEEEELEEAHVEQKGDTQETQMHVVTPVPVDSAADTETTAGTPLRRDESIINCSLTQSEDDPMPSFSLGLNRNNHLVAASIALAGTATINLDTSTPTVTRSESAAAVIKTITATTASMTTALSTHHLPISTARNGLSRLKLRPK